MCWYLVPVPSVPRKKPGKVPCLFGLITWFFLVSFLWFFQWIQVSTLISISLLWYVFILITEFETECNHRKINFPLKRNIWRSGKKKFPKCKNLRIVVHRMFVYLVPFNHCPSYFNTVTFFYCSYKLLSYKKEGGSRCLHLDRSSTRAESVFFGRFPLLT